MKVALDINALCDQNLTGVGVYVLQLLKHLQKEENINLEGFWNISRIKKHKNRNIKKYLELNNKPYLYFNIKKNEIFHGTDFRIPPYCPIPSCVTIHDLACFHKGFTSPSFAENGQKKLNNTLLQKPQGIIVPSHFIENEFKEKFPQYSKIVKTIYHGCDHIPLPHELNLPSQRIKPYLLWVGNIEKRKNLEEALKIFEMIGSEILDLEFIIAGKTGYLGHEIISKINQHLYSQRIILLKYVTQEHLLSLYQHAIALLFLSHYEGFGIPVLEAMRRGCPVVVASKGSHCEIGEDAAFKHKDIHETSQHLYNIVKDQDYKNNIKEKSILHSSLFTWKKTAIETIDLYKSILKKSSGNS